MHCKLNILFRRWIPTFNTLCSAELLNFKVLVPCDPIGYLNNEYGNFKNWIKPIIKGYKWTNLEQQNTLWHNSDWPYAIKLIYPNGKLNYNETLNYINKNSNLSLSKLPDDVLKLFQ